MKRLLPLRNYSPYDEVNMYALIDAQVNDSSADSSTGDDGVFVKISEGDLDKANIEYGSNAIQGKTNYPYVYDELYASATLKVEAAAAGDIVLGITLKETAKTDEHGDNLMRMKPEKREGQDLLLPGQAVPVATTGQFMVSALCIDGAALVAGEGFKLSATAGKIEGATPVTDDAVTIGRVLATGSRTSQTGITDKYEGVTAFIKLG